MADRCGAGLGRGDARNRAARPDVVPLTKGVCVTDQGQGRAPVYPPPQAPGLSPVLERNIQVLHERRRREERGASLPGRIADDVTRFAGSMTFVLIHLLLFGGWVTVNLGLVPPIPRFDESFVVLGTTASVEAIFLSTFVLISQNRMAAAADKRADLDLQVSLLSEHELTKLATLVAAIAEKVGVPASRDPEVEEITRDIAPDAVLDEIEAHAEPRG